MENNFEKVLQEYEEIVSKLNDNNLTLDEALKLYKQGIEKSEECKKILDTKEQKIEEYIR